MILFLSSIFGLVLTPVLQKRCRVDYGSHNDELERMVTELEEGSDPVEGDRSRSSFIRRV